MKWVGWFVQLYTGEQSVAHVNLSRLEALSHDAVHDRKDFQSPILPNESNPIGRFDVAEVVGHSKPRMMIKTIEITLQNSTLVYFC